MQFLLRQLSAAIELHGIEMHAMVALLRVVAGVAPADVRVESRDLRLLLLFGLLSCLLFIVLLLLRLLQLEHA